MKIMKLQDLEGHDVYEFSYLRNYNKDICENHWNKDSIYVSDEDFSKISKYIEKFINSFDYYGVNEVSLCEWEHIKNKAEKDSKCLNEFFEAIDQWIKSDIDKSNSFWILGI